MEFAKSAAAQRRLHELVPGGAHTYARGSDQYPEGMAPVIVRGNGARVVDLDGNTFVEYGMGLRSVTLGHGYRPVVEAVSRAAAEGVSFSRPSAWELRAAERFLTQVPTADMVKFTKNGSDATTAALRLARAATGRELVAVCRDQPFFSVDDWFIGTTDMDAGIPQSTRDATVTFSYNDLTSLEDVLDRHPGQVAAVFLEAATGNRRAGPRLPRVAQGARRQGGLRPRVRRDDHRHAVGGRWCPVASTGSPRTSRRGGRRSATASRCPPSPAAVS